MNDFDRLDELAKSVMDADLQERLKSEIRVARRASTVAQDGIDPLVAIDLRIVNASDPVEAAYWLRVREERQRQSEAAWSNAEQHSKNFRQEIASYLGAGVAIVGGFYFVLHGFVHEGWALMGAGFAGLGIKVSGSSKNE